MDPITLGMIGLGAYLLFRPKPSQTGFTYKRKNGSWRAYFDGKPPSGSHVLRDSDGTYVCWDTPLETESDARSVAEHWVDRYGS